MSVGGAVFVSNARDVNMDIETDMNTYQTQGRLLNQNYQIKIRYTY
jgi:hypothetical protein